MLHLTCIPSLPQIVKFWADQNAAELAGPMLEGLLRQVRGRVAVIAGMWWGGCLPCFHRQTFNVRRLGPQSAPPSNTAHAVPRLNQPQTGLRVPPCPHAART